MNLAVIGSGGREHAICYKLKQSEKVKKLICIPGNAGTKKVAENINGYLSNFEGIYEIIVRKNNPMIDFFKTHISKICFVILGPNFPIPDLRIRF